MNPKLLAVFLAMAASCSHAAGHWPEVKFDPKWTAAIDREAANPRLRGFIVKPKPYAADGDYLAYSRKSKPVASATMEVDDAGLPKVKYGPKFYYNPVTLAQFALASYGRKEYKQMNDAVDRIIASMDPDGALRYPFPYRHYIDTLPLNVGWTSGMAQGQFLSAAGRAYKVTGNKAYLEAGNKALSFLQVKYPLGPMSDMSDLDPSLKDYIFFLEYPAEPNVYTLNGYMFTLLGLYDWSVLAKSKEARDLFEKGIVTLIEILPYYDLGKITSYDLGHITHRAQVYQIPRNPHLAARYHAVHINLLNALASVTGTAELKAYADRWSKY